ncbi:MAG: hypothetical protein AAGF31_07125 [Planctomycetota bacterium]
MAMEQFVLLGEMTGSDALALLSRILHTTCGATLLGGAVYLRFVLAPVAGQDNAEQVLFAGRRKAWAACVGICTLLLLVSGFYNLGLIVSTYEKMEPPYHGLLGLKILLALGLFVVSALIAGKSSGAEKVRKSLKWWLNVAVVLALGIFVCGAVLRSIPHIPKAPPIESEAPAFDAPPTEETTEGANEDEDATIPTLPSLQSPASDL